MHAAPIYTNYNNCSPKPTFCRVFKTCYTINCIYKRMDWYACISKAQTSVEREKFDQSEEN
jgi:hypothetical protein